MIEKLDATGLLCPLPVLKLRKKMKNLEVGDFVEMEATDQGALKDVPHFCEAAGHSLESVEEEGGVIRFLLKKGA